MQIPSSPDSQGPTLSVDAASIDIQARPRVIRLDPEVEARDATQERPIMQQYRRISIGLAVTDAVAIVLAMLFADFVGVAPGFGAQLLSLAIASVVWVGVFHAFGLYVTRHLSPSEEFRRIIAAASMGIVAVILLSMTSYPSAIPRDWIAIMWFAALMLEFCGRQLWRKVVAVLRAKGTLRMRTAIIGMDARAAELAYSLAADDQGFEPVGFISLDESRVSPNGLPVLGSAERLRRAIRDNDLDCVFVVSDAVDEALMLPIMQAVRQEGVDLRVTAKLPDMLTSRISFQTSGDVMSLSLKPVAFGQSQAFIKRAFDLAVASVALVIAAPVIGVAALAIKLTSQGPVVFRQDRVTRNGHVFKCLKFRTMVVDGDRVLKELGIDPTVAFFKLDDDDPRLTNVGRFIRKWSIDELPQLWNVVRGEMSLVGPRPLPADQVEANLEILDPRHEVRAGVTGWWQVNGRSDVSPEEAVRMDLFYIDNWSLSLDLYVLIKTVVVLVTKKGAR